MIKKILKKKLTLANLEKLIDGLGDADKKKVAEATGVEGLSWLKYVAMLTGALAALAGFLVVRSANLTNQAIFASNQAILAQAEASDAWAEYQANSIKARIVETELVASNPLNPNDRAALAKVDEDLRNRQPASKELASQKTSERDQHMKDTEKHMAEKDLLEYAGLAVQMGIVLASMAAMVKKPIALYAAFIVALIGGLLTAYAFIGPMLGL